MVRAKVNWSLSTWRVDWASDVAVVGWLDLGGGLREKLNVCHVISKLIKLMKL